LSYNSPPHEYNLALRKFYGAATHHIYSRNRFDIEFARHLELANSLRVPTSKARRIIKIKSFLILILPSQLKIGP